ncbi:MAG: thioredoxin-dependent thiol peroxidase [Christensenellales bacterium]
MKEKAPLFCLFDDKGNKHCLEDFKGKKVVLYFYPKDLTPGCTMQACGFRNLNEEFEKLNTVIIGVSADNPESHTKFTSKYDLNFLLLSDTDLTVSKLYGAWGEKNRYGKIFFGLKRKTFLIDEEGNIIKEWAAARAKTNPQDVLKFLKTLKG